MLADMARMYPAEFVVTDSRDMGQVGERIVYDALKQMPDDWTVIHNCWRHVLDDKRRPGHEEHITYEADFILLIPRRGILVLEVKNWLSAKVENGLWFRRGTDGRYEAVKHGSPLNQAYLAARYLREELDKKFRWGFDGTSRMEFRCAAVLLGKVENYQNISEVPKDKKAINEQLLPACNRPVPRDEVYDRLYLCGTSALQDNLQERLEKLFCYNNPTSEEELDDVRRYLLQNMMLHVDAAEANSILNTAAAPLCRVLPMLEESPVGVHVAGCAGSGKSSMLCAEAARLALAEGSARVCITCFNYNLAEYLRSHAALKTASVRRFDSSSILVLDNFQTILTRLCSWMGEPLPKDFFSTGTLDTFAQRVQAEGRHCFNHIFVDEAQDFPPEWWKLIRAMLAPGGKLYLFSDAGQVIFGGEGGMPELPVRLRLKHNLRNSAQIATFGAAINGGDACALPLQGPEVTVYPPLDDSHQRADAVKEAINNLLAENYALQDIVVLTPWRRKNSLKDPLLAELIDFPADEETRENAAERLRRCLSPSSTRVLGETIKAYKGLESLAVILTDISAPHEGPDSGFTPNELYVACTRARYRLIIIPTASGVEFLKQLKY